MSQYIANHFISDEIDVDVSGNDVLLGDDYTYGFRVTGAGIVKFVYLKNYNVDNPGASQVRERDLAAGEEFFGRIRMIKSSANGTTATGITALSVIP